MDVTGQRDSRAKQARRSRRSGLTLIEVVVAIALIALMSVGLLGVGLRARRFSETDRLATEARALARERMEELVAIGRARLAQETCTLLNSDSTMSTFDRPIVRVPRLVWHAGDGSVVAAAAAAYAEVHVDVIYTSPLAGRAVTNTYSTLIQ